MNSPREYLGEILVHILKKQLDKKQQGITRLETAIILIAFVVAVAVFAYTALSSGLFSTQKSQETVYSLADAVHGIEHATPVDIEAITNVG